MIYVGLVGLTSVDFDTDHYIPSLTETMVICLLSVKFFDVEVGYLKLTEVGCPVYFFGEYFHLSSCTKLYWFFLDLSFAKQASSIMTAT